MDHENFVLWMVPENSFEDLNSDQKIRIPEKKSQSIGRENDNQKKFLFLKVVRFKRGLFSLFAYEHRKHLIIIAQ